MIEILANTFVAWVILQGVWFAFSLLSIIMGWINPLEKTILKSELIYYIHVKVGDVLFFYVPKIKK